MPEINARVAVLAAGLTILFSLATTELGARPSQGAGWALQDKLRSRLKQKREASNSSLEGGRKYRIAGLETVVWQPAKIPETGAPIIIFSHGFHGFNAQTKFLMRALSDAGYLVLAPNHKDAIGGGASFWQAEQKLGDPSSWSEATHKDRADDIVKLIEALKQDPQWNSRIDWSRFALSGHSLGGYTALGLAGAWQSWKIPDVKAVLALSPYCQPFANQKTLKNLSIPIMYQSGTRDLGVAPFIQRTGGAFDQTPAPVIYVAFEKAGHFSFTNLNRDRKQQELIDYYSLEFLNKYVLQNANAKPAEKLPGVAELRSR